MLPLSPYNRSLVQTSASTTSGLSSLLNWSMTCSPTLKANSEVMVEIGMLETSQTMEASLGNRSWFFFQKERMSNSTFLAILGSSK